MSVINAMRTLPSCVEVNAMRIPPFREEKVKIVNQRHVHDLCSANSSSPKARTHQYRDCESVEKGPCLKVSKIMMQRQMSGYRSKDITSKTMESHTRCQLESDVRFHGKSLFGSHRFARSYGLLPQGLTRFP